MELFKILNLTDGILAHHDVLTRSQAERFIREFPKRFEAQGYYLTSNKERIDPKSVQLELIPLTESECLDLLTQKGEEYSIDSHMGGSFTVVYKGYKNGLHVYRITNKGWERKLEYTPEQVLRNIKID